ncbi:MAG: hypothetical protein ACRDQU_07940 [Pseudonocardiaceae bacterium]
MTTIRPRGGGLPGTTPRLLAGPARPGDSRYRDSGDLTRDGDAVTVEQSHRFALTGADRAGRNRTIILWRESDLVDGRVVRRVVITVDATMNTATVLTGSQAVEVATALRAAAP